MVNIILDFLEGQKIVLSKYYQAEGKLELVGHATNGSDWWKQLEAQSNYITKEKGWEGSVGKGVGAVNRGTSKLARYRTVKIFAKQASVQVKAALLVQL